MQPRPKEVWTHRIYGRKKGFGRFGPLNVNTGNIVGNLIYASCFNKEDAERVCKQLIEENPECEFQVRHI